MSNTCVQLRTNSDLLVMLINQLIASSCAGVCACAHLSTRMLAYAYKHSPACVSLCVRACASVFVFVYVFVLTYCESLCFVFVCVFDAPLHKCRYITTLIHMYSSVDVVGYKIMLELAVCLEG